MNLKALQNGSDIRGTAMGEAANLTDEAVRALAAGFYSWLKEHSKKDTLKILIGRDSRITGEHIAEQFGGALIHCGAKVYDTQMASTPAMYMSTITEGYLFDGAVMITASHLPSDKNGLKFFTRDGGLGKSDIAKIIELAHDVPCSGKPEVIDFMSEYCGILVSRVREAGGCDRPLEGVKIVVDAGNGAGGFFAQDVLAPLGADTAGSIFLEPDGTFPNHVPNPENPAAIEAISAAVKNRGAVLGIVFDTDVDRAGAVAADGSVFNKNKLIALMSAIVLRDEPNSTIVTDSTTSTGLHDFIIGRGGTHHRFRRGYKNVIDEAKRLGAPLAMETSGHGALRENYYLDDGAYLIVKLLIELARGNSLGDLISDLKEPIEEAEFRLPLTVEDFKAYGNSIIEDLAEYVKNSDDMECDVPNYEGIRAHTDYAWFLLRLSLHEPLLPLNIESDTEGGLAKLKAKLYEFLSKYDGLDCTKLK